jgi:hypothetical protein
VDYNNTTGKQGALRLTIGANDKPLPNENFLQFLRRKREFYQLLVESWSIVEKNTDELLTRQFGLYCEYSDPKVQTLTRSSFERKIRSLKKMGVLSLEEYRIIHDFKDRRNEFFHKLGADILFTMTEDEKNRTMDEAVKVAQLTFDIVSHRFDQLYLPKSNSKAPKSGAP